jgi:galactose mutarotase-like enzyme
MRNGSLYRILGALVIVTSTTFLLWGIGCKVKRVHISPSQAPAAPFSIGGKEPYTATRLQEGTGASPEFLSMTVLPGRGMNIYQITAYLPGLGVTNLLASPPLEQFAPTLNGQGKDNNGDASSLVGGAFLLPFTNQVHGMLSADGQHVVTDWNGHTISLPANTVNPPGMMPSALHGLILDRAIDGQLDDAALLDGHELTATMHGGNFGSNWPSTSDVQFKILMSARAVDITVTVQNTGTEPEPVSVGWHPYFAIPSGQRAQARLHLPADARVETTDEVNMQPTGRMLPVTGTPYDFTAHEGVALDNLSLDDDFVQLKSMVFDSGPTIELMDPAANYGLRMICRSPEIQTLHVYAPADKNYVVIEPQFNYMDPFNKVWKGGDNGMVVLKPGQQVKWMVRLEFYSAMSETPQPGTY